MTLGRSAALAQGQALAAAWEAWLADIPLSWLDEGPVRE